MAAKRNANVTTAANCRVNVCLMKVLPDGVANCGPLPCSGGVTFCGPGSALSTADLRLRGEEGRERTTRRGSRACAGARRCARGGPEGPVTVLLSSACVNTVSSLWYRALEAPVNWQAFLVALLPALLVSWLAARLVRRLSRRAMHAIVGDTIAHASPLVRGPVRLVAAAGFVLTLG